MPPSTLVLATRSSPLALRQSHWVKAELERAHPGCQVKIRPLGTTGDRMRHQPLPQIGGKGLFTRELEEALLAGRAQLAVHSLKDLPTELAPGLVLAAVPRREDPRDALISRSRKPLAQLPAGVRIGTSSVRRAAQLKRLRPDAQIEPLRGNLETRLRKLRQGPLEAIVLAAAGLRRMGWADEITQYFSEETLCPAVGQGALGIEARADDRCTRDALAVVEDSWARLCVTAERALLQHLGGGCQIPIAAFTLRLDEQLVLTALVIRPDGSELIRARECSLVPSVEAAEDLGKKAAESLLRQGARKILDSMSPAQGPFPMPQAP